MIILFRPLFISLLLVLFSPPLSAQLSDAITIEKIVLPQTSFGFDIEIFRIQLPEDQVSFAVSKILRQQSIQTALLTYDDASSAEKIKVQKILESSPVALHSLSSEQANTLLPAELKTVSTAEQNTLRTLLIIRCIGLGTGLYVGTGSSFAVAAYAGFFNYILMELLYIPNKVGRMPGVDFVNNMISRAKNRAQKENPNISIPRLQKIEGLTNFLINYTMNLAMLIPFVGMTGSDMHEYFQEFLKPELYDTSARLAVITTLFMSSWKMAVTKWNEQKRQLGYDVMTLQNQSRMVNGVDFMLSFINPGFWAGQALPKTAVTVIGITGFAAYFYYDAKNYLRKTQMKSCIQFFG